MHPFEHKAYLNIPYLPVAYFVNNSINSVKLKQLQMQLIKCPINFSFGWKDIYHRQNQNIFLESLRLILLSSIHSFHFICSTLSVIALYASFNIPPVHLSGMSHDEYRQTDFCHKSNISLFFLPACPSSLHQTKESIAKRSFQQKNNQ